MNYNKMKFTVGLFLVLFFTAVVVFGFFFLQKKGAFNHNYLYYTSSKSAIAFQIGMPVKYSGFNIGTISQLVLEETGEVSISILIDQNYQRFLTQESKLILKKPLIGSAHIELHRSANSTLLEEESYLPLSTSDDINDIVSKLEPVSDQLIKIVDNIETITSRIASEDSPLSKTLLNLEKFSNTLANNDSLLTTVTGDKDVTKTVSKALDSVYQTLKNIRYSPNEKKLFLDINSEFNNFQEKFSLSLDAQLAKEFHSNSSLLEPSVYFDIKEGSILLVGATISYKKQHFLAQKTEENYTEQTNIHFVTNDTQLDLGKVDIEYKVIAKNIKPPQWFFHIDANQGEIIGYGSGVTQDQAKKFALKEISEQLEVTVRSESSYEKQMQGNYVSNSNKSTIKTETTAQKLKGTQTIKQEKKDNIWYTAVMYKKGE